MVVNYPKILCEVSNELAKARFKLNESIRNSSKNYSMGSERLDFLIEYKGILGELIVCNWLIENGKNYKFTEIIGNGPIKEADIVLDGIRYDVKTTSIQNMLIVTKPSHDKAKDLYDKYWFVTLVDDGIAIFRTEDFDDVGKWPIKQMKVTEAYYKRI